MKCTKCGENIALQCCDDEPKRIAGEPVCEDCYFRELGDMMEKHPPGLPHRTFTVNAKVVSRTKGTIKNICRTQTCPLCEGTGIYDGDKALIERIMWLMLAQTAESDPEDGALELRLAIIWAFMDQCG